jgi:membrane associated rhomboid family serine protease
MLPLRDHVPTRTFPFVNYALIAANVVAFLWERSLAGMGVAQQEIADAFGLVPATVFHDPAHAVVSAMTAMFLHASWVHLGGNMLFLWIFGDNVEDALGHVKYLAFYLLAGLAAATMQVVTGPESLIPMVGASGAIAGVLAAYVVLHPRAPVTVLNPIPLLWLFFGLFFTLPAWVIIGEFFVVNLFQGFGSLFGAEQGGVAFMAHVGGFVFGLVALRLFLGRPKPKAQEPWDGWRAPRPAPIARLENPYYRGGN